MRDIAKTLSYGSIHIVVGFSIAYLLTGSLAIAGGIALLEPIANTVVFYLHEKVWKRFPERTNQPRGAAARRSRSLTASPRPLSGTGITAMPVNLASSRA